MTGHGRFVRWRTCEGKRQFSSFRRALAAIKALIRRHGPQDGWLHPYRCPFCGRYHIGHARGKDRQRGGKRP